MKLSVESSTGTLGTLLMVTLLAGVGEEGQVATPNTRIILFVVLQCTLYLLNMNMVVMLSLDPAQLSALMVRLY